MAANCGFPAVLAALMGADLQLRWSVAETGPETRVLVFCPVPALASGFVFVYCSGLQICECRRMLIMPVESGPKSVYCDIGPVPCYS